MKLKKLLFDILHFRHYKKICKRMINKKCWNQINKKYAGVFSEQAFCKKNAALKKLGFNIEENVRVVGPIFITCNLTIKKNSFIGRNCSFEGDGLVEIGENVDVGPNVIFNTGGHLIGEHNRRAGTGLVTSIKIGNGCWIGNKSLLFNDISIGDGSIVAAGAIVKESFPNDVLIAGNPGMIKKHYK